MEYEGVIYRPPSEADSLLVQVTIGCSHNECTFCPNYKGKRFRIRPMAEIRRDLEECGRQYSRYVRRIFLCDGNALVMKQEQLREILALCRELFPFCERVGIYASAKDVLRKTPEQLRELRQMGLGILYLGLESGSDEVLRRVKKGITASEMVEAAGRVRASGILLSVMAITGLGGRELSREHALETAKALNGMQPDYVGLLALMVHKGTELYEEVARGEFTLLSPREVVEEMRLLVGELELDGCFFSSVHASNYVTLRGSFPQDQGRLLKELDYYLENQQYFKGESHRLL